MSIVVVVKLRAFLRAGVEAAEHTGEDKDEDVGYSTDFLGWALLLRGAWPRRRRKS